MWHAFCLFKFTSRHTLFPVLWSYLSTLAHENEVSDLTLLSDYDWSLSNIPTPPRNLYARLRIDLHIINLQMNIANLKFQTIMKLYRYIELIKVRDTIVFVQIHFILITLSYLVFSSQHTCTWEWSFRSYIAIWFRLVFE